MVAEGFVTFYHDFFGPIPPFQFIPSFPAETDGPRKTGNWFRVTSSCGPGIRDHGPNSRHRPGLTQ